MDSERDIAPLRRADDAIYIDTTDMTIPEVVEKITDLVLEKKHRPQWDKK